MKNLVRGSIVLSVIGLFVVLIYAQSATEIAPETAKVSQKAASREIITKPINNTEVNKEVNKNEVEKAAGQEQEKGNKVEKTAMVSKSKARRLVSKGTFIATAYCLRGRTAMGHKVRKGLIAADRRVIPLGTHVNIEGGKYSGDYLVSDTGGKIKGKRIDIWMASCSEAIRFGRRRVTVNLIQ